MHQSVLIGSLAASSLTTSAATIAAPSSKIPSTSPSWRAKSRAHELRGRDRLRALCPSAEAFIDALARRGEPLQAHVARLGKLIDGYGAGEVDAALAVALARGAISAASVAHLCDQRARQRKAPPPVGVVLPDDPRVRDLRVTPHGSF
jgi:hypothetical protein